MAVDGAAARRRRRPRRRHPRRRPPIWEAAGHLANFTDPLVDCKVCQERLPPRQARRPRRLPAAAARKDSFTEARQFNLMFKTHAGPVEDDGAVAYLRPETAQGMFVELRQRAADHAARSRRSASPRSASRFRNEITPAELRLPHPRVRADGDGVLRPARRGAAVVRVLVRGAARAGTSSSASRPSCCGCGPTTPTSCRHYSAGTSDVEFLFPWGWDELEGIANRSDYDLTQHAKHSGEKLDYFDQATGERYVPHVIEPAAGATRTMMAFLLAAYDEEEVGGEARTVLRLHPRLAPYKVAVLPAVEEGHAHAARPARCSALLAAALHVRLRRDPVDRPPLPPPGRDRHAAAASPSTSTPSTTGRSRSATGTRRSRCGCPSPSWSTR